jgi:S1-C subfamily serine protease
VPEGGPRSRAGVPLAPVNLLDLALILLVVVAIAGGLRLGFVARAASWIGLAVGVVLATWTVPAALALVEGGEPSVRLFTGLVVLAITVTVVASLFQAIGLRARRSIATTPLSSLDRTAGALAGAVAVIALMWFLLPAAAEVPGQISRQVRSSAIAGLVERSTPEPPDAVRAFRSLVDTSRFPEVFADLQPAPVSGPPPEAIPVDQAVVDRSTASTVNVEADGCGRRYEGSGFAAAPDTIVTNAHVVAGSDTVSVKRPDGEVRDATVVAFDGARDLAVLAVPDLGQEPLERAEAELGGDGVVIGYPGGQDTPRVAPARVEDRRNAIGRDIYARERTEREVLFLSADLQQGDSGSPVIDLQGRVTGVVFAISPDQPTSSFALDLAELEAILAAERVPGDSGRCI